MSAATHVRPHGSRWTPALRLGILGGVLGAVGMAMIAMIAAATYQGTGLLTPLYHIGSAFGGAGPMEAMMTSMEQAEAGSTLTWFTGPALTGLVIHMATGMIWGAVFGLLVAGVNLPRAAVVPAGITFGIVVMVVMAFAILPALASSFGSGDPIRNMASMVGGGTFTAEHALFGLVVGLTTLPLGSRTVDVTTSEQAARREPTPTRTRERAG